MISKQKTYAFSHSFGGKFKILNGEIQPSLYNCDWISRVNEIRTHKQDIIINSHRKTGTHI